MDTITVKDGTEIFYKDWGTGQPIVFHHGWPLSADDWDSQMLFFLGKGYRVIAHDRRGHGRSTQTWTGNDMDTYAADSAALVAHLDLKNAIHVGHSTGGGEVARYVAQYGGDGQVAKAALISAITPVMLKSDKNPGGLPMEVFDAFRAGMANRAQFYRDIPEGPFYGFNRPGAKVSQRRSTSSRTSRGEPKGRVFWVSTPAPQNTRREPYFRFSSAGSMPVAEHCTGLTMSKPASIKLSRNRSTLPQECLKHFH